jgi:hypothetical protein
MNEYLLNAAHDDGPSLLTIATTAALVTAAIEYPISQYYATVPPTRTGQRMLIAGGMAFISTLIGGAILSRMNK